MQIIDDLKSEIKSYNVRPFSAADLNCSKDGVYIHDNKINTTQFNDLMDVIGLRARLTNGVLKEPDQNWKPLQEALQTIDRNKRFGYIADKKENITCVIKDGPSEATQLDYDDRIDDLVNSIIASENSISRAYFSPENATFFIDTTGSDEINCGDGDLWKFGVTTQIGLISQKYSNYFLRLLCTNGMTTRENLVYRQAHKTKNVGRQFLNFIKENNASSLIVPRVEKMKNHRASFYEMEAVADVLTTDQQDVLMPDWYLDTIIEHKNRGIDLSEMPAKQQRLVYTKVNNYDVFNLATALSSHHRDEIGTNTALGLNKVAGEMFINGPQLLHNVINIYDN